MNEKRTLTKREQYQNKLEERNEFTGNNPNSKHVDNSRLYTQNYQNKQNDYQMNEKLNNYNPQRYINNQNQINQNQNQNHNHESNINSTRINNGNYGKILF